MLYNCKRNWQWIYTSASFQLLTATCKNVTISSHNLCQAGQLINTLKRLRDTGPTEMPIQLSTTDTWSRQGTNTNIGQNEKKKRWKLIWHQHKQGKLLYLQETLCIYSLLNCFKLACYSQHSLSLLKDFYSNITASFTLWVIWAAAPYLLPSLLLFIFSA